MFTGVEVNSRNIFMFLEKLMLTWSFGEQLLFFFHPPNEEEKSSSKYAEAEK